jgi:RNA recognition motif-containing protein
MPSALEEREVKLFVGQIPRSWGEAELEPVFAEFGAVNEIYVLRDKNTGRSKGAAFVKFSAQGEADACIDALHAKRCLEDCKPLQISYADGEQQRLENKLFVGGLPYTATEDDVLSIFSPFGTIKEIIMLRQPNGASKGAAFVKYESRSCANAAIAQLDGTAMKNTTLRVSDADHKKKRGTEPPWRMGMGMGVGMNGMGMGVGGLAMGMSGMGISMGGMGMGMGSMGMGGMGGMGMAPPFMGMGGMGSSMGAGGSVNYPVTGGAAGDVKLFVGQLSPQASRQGLLGIFGWFGAVKEIHLLPNHTAGAKGSAFVKYHTHAEAQAAVQAVHGMEVPGNGGPLVVRFADPSKRGSGQAGQEHGGHVEDEGGGGSTSTGLGGNGAWGNSNSGDGIEGGNIWGSGGSAVGWHIPTAPTTTSSSTTTSSTTTTSTTTPPSSFSSSVPPPQSHFKLFVGQVSLIATEFDLACLLEQAALGPVLEAVILRRPNGSSKGAAFVKFGQAVHADRAIACLHQKFVMPGAVRPMNVSYAPNGGGRRAPGEGAVCPPTMGQSHASGGLHTRGQHPQHQQHQQHAQHLQHPQADGIKLFVGGLPSAATEADLWAIFSPFGELREVFIIRRPDGGSKGAAFVKYAEEAAADAAVQAMNDILTLPGSRRALAVRHANATQAPSGAAHGAQPMLAQC